MQAKILLGRSEHDALRRLPLGLANLDELARRNIGVDARQAIEANDPKGFIFRVGQDGAGCCGPLAHNFDHIALEQPKGAHYVARDAGKAVATLFRLGIGHLQLVFVVFCIGHCPLPHSTSGSR